MISTKLKDALIVHLKNEIESAYLYFSMTAWFSAEGWDGMAAWMQNQAMEEMMHAKKFFDYLNSRSVRVVLQAIDQPKANWASPLDVFQDTLKHEQFVTSRIAELMKLSNEEIDYPTQAFLQWFVTEQVEEEASVSKIVNLLKKIGDSGNGLVMLDQQLSRRGTPGAEN